MSAACSAGAVGSSGAAASEWPILINSTFPGTCWLDPNQGITLNTGAVEQWVDRVSGNIFRNDGVTAQRPPFSATAVNGKPGMGTDSFNRWLLGGTALAALIANDAPYSVVAIATLSSSAAVQRILVGLGSVSSSLVNAGVGVTPSGANFVAHHFRENSGVDADTGATTLMTTSSTRVLCTTFDGATDAARHYPGGTAEAGNPFSNTKLVPGDVICIGAMWKSAAFQSGFNGLWSHIVIVPGALSPSQVADGIAWANGKV